MEPKKQRFGLDDFPFQLGDCLMLYLSIFGDVLFLFTPPKTNMSPKKGPFQKDSSLPTTIFEGTC